MRPALVFGGTLALLVAARFALAQFAPQPAPPPSGPGQKVTAPSAIDVYSGPGDGCYLTGKLRPGQEIRVFGPTRGDPNWLEIEPPADSVSYVDLRHLLTNPKDPREGFVTVPEGDLLPVYAGGLSEDTEPKVERYKLQRGAIVALVQGRRKFTTSTGATLVPIGSWKNEVRYIKASALGSAPGRSRWSRPGGNRAAICRSRPGPTRCCNSTSSSRRPWPARTSTPRTARRPSNTCNRRRRCCKPPRRCRGPARPGSCPATPMPPRLPPGTRKASWSRRGKARRRRTPPCTTPGRPAARPPKANWSSWGILQKTTFQLDGQQSYRLVDAQNSSKLILYATAVPGKSLESYVGKLVTLYGPSYYRSDEHVRSDFMTVYYISPATPAKDGR